MKLITFVHDGAARPGVWLDTHVLDLCAASGGSIASLRDVVSLEIGGLEAVVDGAAASCLYPAEAVKLLAPVPAPERNVFCVGRNYLDHVAEGDRVRGVETKLPEWPQFFTKGPHTLNHPGAPVPYFQALTNTLDYEVELAVVIGRGGRDIPANQAFDHIFGYTIANDVTARNIQYRHQQWFKGKSLDGSLPIGPWIVTADEIGDPSDLELTLTLNGEERQRATVSMMIFSIATIIEQLSAGLTLQSGDIILTGTPSGVGYAREPQGPMQPGDEVVCRIDRIGVLRNPIQAA